MLANEGRVKASPRQIFQLPHGLDAALADQAAVGRHARRQFQRVFQARDERPQIAIVDADEPGLARQHARQVLPVVQLHQGLHPQRGGVDHQPRKLRGAQDLGDEQDGVGAGEARFHKLIAVENKVLP